VIAILLGVPLAWVQARMQFRGQNILRALTTLPMVLPPVVGGVALLLAFALVFQTPVVMIALARVGIITSAQLRKWRKFAFFGFFVAGGFLAPDGNPITMTLLAGPMYVLYEASLWIIVLLEKSWRPTAGAA